MKLLSGESQIQFWLDSVVRPSESTIRCCLLQNVTLGRFQSCTIHPPSDFKIQQIKRKPDQRHPYAWNVNFCYVIPSLASK